MTGYVERMETYRSPLFQDKKPLLTMLDAELTERCSNQCIHCYIRRPAVDHKTRMAELSTRQWISLLEEAAGLGCLLVRFTGGEPLLREDFEEIYIAARRLGLSVLLFTSGTLITPSHADLFARIPPRRNIEITIYGMSEESYEAVTRASGSFHAAMEGLEHLRRKEVPFEVKGVLLPPNKAEVEAFETWAGSVPWMKGPPRYILTLYLSGQEGSRERNARIARLRPSPEEVVAFLSRRRESYVTEGSLLCSGCTSIPGDRLFACGAGDGYALVDAYGGMHPCLLLKPPEMTHDVTRGSLLEGMALFRSVLPSIRAVNPLYLERCSRCLIRGLCEQCPAHSWNEHGSLDQPVEYLCAVAHAHARAIGLLGERERAWEVSGGRERTGEP